MKIGRVCMICLGAGIALSVFEYALRIGATQSDMGGKKAVRIAAVYSGIQLLLLFGADSRADPKCRTGSADRTAVADAADSPAAVLFLFMYADSDP